MTAQNSIMALAVTIRWARYDFGAVLSSHDGEHARLHQLSRQKSRLIEERGLAIILSMRRDVHTWPHVTHRTSPIDFFINSWWQLRVNVIKNQSECKQFFYF